MHKWAKVKNSLDCPSFMVDLAQSLLEENQIKMISGQFNDSL